MKKFLPVLFFLFSTAGVAQTLHIDSTRFITGSQCCAQIDYSIPTADKGILFVGSTSTNPGGIIPYFPIDTFSKNVLIGKIDSNQHISWIKVYGGSSEDGGGPVCQTPDGGYAILAGTTSNDGNITGFKGAVDMWLIKIDASGNLLWEKTYGSTQSDGPLSIANTRDHGFILLGQTNGSDGDVPFHYGSFFSMDWLVIKTDSVGNIQWTKDLGGTRDEGGYSSIVAVGSNYYLAGSSNSTDYDCTDTAWHAGVNTNTDYHVLKLDASGNVLWDSSYGGSGGDGIYNAMFDIRDSTIVITGNTTSSDYMVTGYHGSQDMWVIKVNRDGTLIWQKTLGGTVEDNGTGICAGVDGGYMAYGSTSTGPLGGEDCWLFALDSAGNEIANKIFGGTGAELPNSIVPYLKGYVTTGISNSTVFTDGITTGRNCVGENGFISYVDYSPLAVNNLGVSIEPILNVYPNPAHDYLKIIIAKNNRGNITITNPIGQIVYREEFEHIGKSADISVAGWAYGLYLIKWEGIDGSAKTEKLIIN